MKTDTKISPDWLADKNVQRIFDVLEGAGGDVRIVGGCVRNTLFNASENSDIDFATTLLPDQMVAAFKSADIKTVPTGIEHGTVTAVIDGVAFEVTTLRSDIETDGRHAVVSFGTDFTEDAKRRDFTVNALYVDRHGMVYDYVDGFADIGAKNFRFIGQAGERIEEDYLRILRFFRFFAWYGQHRPDTEGLKACTRLKEGLNTLSAERVWQEMQKLLAAPDASRALLWMRQTGVLTVVLPESEKWGIDAIPPLMKAEAAHHWSADPVIRLMAMIAPRMDRVNDVAARWKLPNKVRDRLRVWASLPQQLPEDLEALKALAYWHGKQALLDALMVSTAMKRDDAFAALHAQIADWDVPVLPIKGADLLARGFEKGPQLGAKLKELETAWVESGFTLEREELLKRLDSD